MNPFIIVSALSQSMDISAFILLFHSLVAADDSSKIMQLESD